MKLRIKDFRNYQGEHEFTFPTESLVLLNGPSGSGKSTLFQSIFWCLYGGMHHINNHKIPNANVKVELIWGEELKIYRQKRPELFRVTYQGRDYEGEIAQQLILHWFGSKELFQASCYLSQNNRNTLFSLSSTEKMKLIQELSFNQENPELYIERIEQQIQTFHSKYQLEETVLKQNIKQWEAERERIQRKYDLTLYQPHLNFEEEYTKLKEHEQILSQQYQTHLQYQGQLKLLEQSLSLLSEIPDEYLNKEEIEIEHSINRLEQTLFQYHLIEEWHKIQKSLRSLECQLEQYRPYEAYHYTQDDLRRAWKQEEDKKKLRKYHLPYQKEAVEQELQRLLALPHHYTQEQYLHLLRQEEKEKRAKQVLAKYNLPYRKDSLNRIDKSIPPWPLLKHQWEESKRICDKYKLSYEEEVVKKIKLWLSYLPYREEAKRLFHLRQILKEKQEVSEQQLLQLNEAINKAHLSTNILKCPHCHQSLRLLNHCLEPANCEPISPRIIMELASQYDELKALKKNQEELRNLEQRLKQFSIEELLQTPAFTPLQQQELQQVRYISPEQLEKSVQSYELSQIEIDEPLDEMISLALIKEALDNKTKLEDLKSIQIEEELDVNTIKACLERTQILMEWKRLNERSTELNQLLGESRNHSQKQLKQELQLWQKTKEKLKLLRKIDEIKGQLNPHLEETLKQCKAQLKRLELIEEINQQVKLLEQNKQQLEASRGQLIQLQQTLIKLEELKSQMIELEYQNLQLTVDSINLFLDDMGKELFDDPITIRLALFKPLKTKEKIKPQVNLNILYRGGEYDNINQLSGGEGDRVSLLLTLALSHYCKFPFLLLDESLASLDLNLREMALRVIRKAMGKKTIICVNHGDVEGYYDHIIDIKNN